MSLDQRKKAKVNPDAMEVDSAEAPETLISLKESKATTIEDGEILKRLRPVVFKLKPYDDTASLCSDLDKIDFLEQCSSIASKPKDGI